jgi:hypothetical protein
MGPDYWYYRIHSRGHLLCTDILLRGLRYTALTLASRACLWSTTSVVHSIDPRLRMNKVHQVRLAKPSTLCQRTVHLERVVWLNFSVVFPDRIRLLCFCDGNVALMGLPDRTGEIKSTLSIMSEKRDVLFRSESMVGKYFIIEIGTCSRMVTWNRQR